MEKDFIDASKIDKLVIERERKMKIWFEKIEGDTWEVSFSDEYGNICPVFGLWIDCNNCIFDDEEGCSGYKLRVNTKAVVKICFGIGDEK